MTLTSWPASALPWLSIVPILVLSAVAVSLARRPPPVALRGRLLRFGGTILLGFLATAGAVWQAREIGAAPQSPMGLPNTASAQTAQPAVPDLQLKIRSLENQVNQLEHITTMRTITPDIASQLADYLKQFGSHQVVVSCAPNDVEAYSYATDLIDVLKSANWDARGPEMTTIFGNVQAMAINVYDNAAPSGDTAKILLAGFAKFSIPFQTRVAPSQTPSDAAVELFVGAQPTLRAAASTGRGIQ
jgi:TolA-binding protein